MFRGRSLDISYFYVFGCPVHIHDHKDHLGKFDENVDDGFFLGYSLVAKALRVFNIRRQEMEEMVHVKFSEDDEAISQSSTEGDEINFNENKSFPDDEFLEPRSKVTKFLDNTKYFPYIPRYENTTPSESPIHQIIAMQEELNQFERNKVWTLVLKHHGRIDYKETFAPVARLEAIRIFLAYAAYMGFTVYQMNVKSAFLNGKISKEVYVQQPPGFKSSEFPKHVCKLDKALYGLKQVSKAWYETLLKFLIKHKFVRGPDESGLSVNETLFRSMIWSLMYLTASKPISNSPYVSVLAVTQPKAPTDLKTKKRITPSSKPKSPYKVLDQNIKEDVKDAGFVAMEEEEIDITPKDATEGDAFESLFSLRSIPDDDLASMTGFETQDSADHVSEEGIETSYVSADKPAQLHALGHLHEELCLPQNKDFIKSLVLESIAEELPQVEAHVQKNLQHQLPNIILKPMYKEFNAFNKLKSQRFILLQKELIKSLHNKLRKSISLKDIVSLLEATEVFKKANAEGDKWEKNNPESHTEEKDAQYPNQSKGDQDSGATTVTIVQGDQPSAQVKLNFLISSSSIPSPTPLKSIMPEPPKVTEANKITLDQFTKHLNKTTSSIISPTPLRDLTPAKEPTPPRDFTKGKEVTITEEQVNKLFSYQEEGGSNPKMPKIKSFTTLVGPLFQEEFNAQIKEIKMLADLKAEKEKSEQELKMFNQATLKA
nr:hypothetical protein [Tanacetum cinerariifolium]